MIICIDKDTFNNAIPAIEEEVKKYSDVFNLDIDTTDEVSVDSSKRHNVFFFMYYVVKNNLIKISDKVQFYQTCIDSDHPNSEKLVDILDELHIKFSILNNKDIWDVHKIG